MITYQCPLCYAHLMPDSNTKGYTCPQRHHFDLAKEGYLNLLPVQHKHSKLPGDNKAMLQARHAFLAAGYYDPLVDVLRQLIGQNTDFNQSNNLLDLGCGEGFYCRRLAQDYQNKIHFHGVDISKFAIGMAAKLLPTAQFAVASMLRLPYLENSFDWIVRVFAPSNPAELKRILKPGGFLLTVTPGPEHLWQLKELIYQEARKHPLNDENQDNFVRLESTQCRFRIKPEVIHRMALLQMTPFAWKASLASHEKLETMDTLDIETDFIVTLSQLNL